MVDHETEQQFVDGFNGKFFPQLSVTQKDFIILLNDGKSLDDDSIINVYSKTENVKSSAQHTSDFPNENRRRTSKPKRDVIVTFNGTEKKISLKSGGGNSYHQEHWTYFSKLLKNLGATQLELDAFDNFIHSRDKKYFKSVGEECTKWNFSASDPEFCNAHTKEKNIMQNFLDRKKKELLIHFIKTGYCSKEGFAEFVFHGKKDNILCESVFASVNFIIKNILDANPSSTAELHVGALTFQRWNLCPEHEQKLDSMQCKGASITEYMI
jgi:hypothetical protein